MTFDCRINAALWVATLAFALSACASAPDRRTTPNPTMPLDELRIVVQVCLPDRTVAFEDVAIDLTGISEPKTLREERAANGYPEGGEMRNTAPITEPQPDPDRATVRRWLYGSDSSQLTRPFLRFGEVLNRRGLLSASSGHIGLWGNSERNQPVYENQGHRPEDTIALDVIAAANGEFVTYWYKPHGTIPQDRFSDWQEPISQETVQDAERSKNPTFWNLTHGREIEIRPVAANAPKIRYRLMTVEAYYDQYRFWKRAQKAIAEKFYRGVDREEREKRHFVPRMLGVIPGC